MGNLSSIKKQLEEQYGDIMEIDIFVKGDSLVYSYQYKTQLPNADQIAVQLEKGITEQVAVFQNLTRMIEQSVEGVETPSVIVEYKNKDGSMIYTAEITSDGLTKAS